MTGRKRKRMSNGWRTNRRRARPTGSAAGPTTHRHNQNGSRNPNRPEFKTEANDYGVPDRAGLQSVIDVIGEHYLHLAREWGWNDTEVRDAMYVETKQRGWCRE